MPKALLERPNIQKSLSLSSLCEKRGGRLSFVQDKELY